MMEANGYSQKEKVTENQTTPSHPHDPSNRVLGPSSNMLRQSMIPPSSLLHLRGLSPHPHQFPIPPQPPTSLHNPPSQIPPFPPLHTSSNQVPLPPLHSSSNQIPPPPQIQSTPPVQGVPTQMDMKMPFPPLYFSQSNIPYSGSNGTSTPQDSSMKMVPSTQQPQPMYGYPPIPSYYLPPQNIMFNPNLFKSQGEGGEITFPTVRSSSDSSVNVENVNIESKNDTSQNKENLNKKKAKDNNKKDTKNFSIEDLFIDNVGSKSSSYKKTDSPLKTNNKQQMIPKKKQEYNHRKERYHDDEYENIESDKDLLREILNELRNRRQPTITKRQIKSVLEELINVCIHNQFSL